MLEALAAYARTHELPEAVQRDLELALRLAARSTAPTLVLEAPDTASGQPDPPRDAELPIRIADRYEDLGPLGEGGMADVRRVRDLELKRTLAMKVMRPHLAASPKYVSRFMGEAQATAQLQHPNIVPIHEVGRLSDGRLWYTMREVRGRTLSQGIDEVHGASGDRWEAAPSGWTLRRLIHAFYVVCQAVAYAHERGVVHRDLKPENVMVGRHGEVYVLDWGLAKVAGVPASESTGPVATDHSEDGRWTQVGEIAGTPAYMPPEQARGEQDRIDARSDVYALGAMLYQILSGRPPYEGPPRDVVDQVREGPPAPVGSAEPDDGRPALSAELIRICQHAMARDPADRYRSATSLADAVQGWIDGTHRRDLARELTAAALEGASEADALKRQAEHLESEGEALLASIERWRPEEDKADAWSRLDEAAQLRLDAELRQAAVDEGLNGALRLDPSLPEAHAALAERFRQRHAVAERDRDVDTTARTARLVELHANALPQAHEIRQCCAAYLSGVGALTLHTDPPGAEVALFRLTTRNRRLLETFERSLGTTPLVRVSLPMGSYVCVVSHPDRDDVRYPVHVTRRGHWGGVAPGDRDATPIWLPPRGHLGPDEIYVPAGWFRAGGDPDTEWCGPGERMWRDAVVLGRVPVTNARYLAFLDDLVARGRTAEALRHAPRERGADGSEGGPLIYGFDGQRFSLQADVDGDVWRPGWPAVNVDWFGARAYLAWLAERTGRPWRLPAECDWEKAARGVDGRFFPWGDQLDPSWCCMVDSHPTGHRVPAEVDQGYPVDLSVYGVRGLGGNVKDWCADRHGPVLNPEPTDRASEDPLALRVVRGGHFGGPGWAARSATRLRTHAGFRDAALGFRGAWRL